MKKPWLAAIGNFFFMGLGTLYNGQRVLTGIGLTIGALILTFVEFQVRPLDESLYWLMFGAVFVVNTVLAIDGYNEARAINAAA